MPFGTLREANISRDKETDPEGKAGVLFHSNELGGEVGEAMNIIKKIVREQLGFPGSTASVFDLADELADVIICVDKLAMRYHINLREAIEMKFNAKSREWGVKTKLIFPDHDFI